jgi:hypothetical protein
MIRNVGSGEVTNPCDQPGRRRPVRIEWPPDGWAAIQQPDEWNGSYLTLWAGETHRRVSTWPYKVTSKLDAALKPEPIPA